MADIGKALSRISSNIERGRRRSILEQDAAAQRAAEADIVAGKIDPMRAENEIAYQATVTRNQVNDEFNSVMTELDIPTSTVSQMDPDEFKEHLGQRASDFLKASSENKGADIRAEIFNRFMAANQSKLVAVHAKNHREKIKVSQNEQAITALAKMPPMNPEAFNLNAAELIELTLPKTTFTEQERRQTIMMSAQLAAKGGDNRLLEYAKENYDAETLAPNETLIAAKSYKQWQDGQENDFWNHEYARYEELARDGKFTEEDWHELITNQDAIDNLGGRSQFDQWLRAGRVGQQKATMAEQYFNQFERMEPMVGATPAQVNETVDFYLMNAHAMGVDKTVAFDQMAQRLGAQNVVSTDLKDTFNSALGRAVWSPAYAENEQFQAAFTMADALSQHLDVDQLQDQLGDDAFENFKFIQDYMRFNGGEFSDAIAVLSSATQKRKDAGKQFHVSSIENKQLDGALEEVLDASVETEDRGLRGFLGMVRNADNALVTGPILSDIKRQAEILVLRGWNPSSAVEHATLKVSKDYKQFGGESHYTGGATAGNLFGFPSGTGANELDDAWKFVAGEFGKDPDNVAPVLNGKMVTIVDRETGAELPPMPADTLGAMWQAKQMADIEAEEANNAQEQDIKNQKIADGFQQRLYNWYGADSGHLKFTGDVSIADFERADMETKLQYYGQWKRDYYNGIDDFARVLVTAGDFWGNAIGGAMDWFADQKEVLNLEEVVGKDEFTTGGGFGGETQAPARDDLTPEAANLLPVRGSEKVSGKFKSKVVEIAKDIDVDPNDLMAVMAFETGGTFSPSVKNAAGSSATGLIQFMASTAKGLGTSTEKLAKMSAEDQLDVVKKYFSKYKGRLKNVQDVYMAVLWPKAIGKDEDYVLWKKGTKAYEQNRGLDVSGNGKVTAGEAASKVKDILRRAKKG